MEYKQFNSSKSLQEGQALITLLFIMLIGITVVASATAVLFANSLSTTTSEQGQMAYYYAESGIEDGMLQLLRNPSYTGTYQLLSTGGGLAQVTISFNSLTNTDTIVSVGTSGNAIRKVQAQAQYSSGTFTTLSWGEIN